MGKWRSIVLDPPSKTGRYCVGHRGQVYGNAYYTANEGDTHHPVGWSQLPSFGPTYWLDGGIDSNDVPRLWCGVDGSGRDRMMDEMRKESRDRELARKVRKSWIGRLLFKG